MWHRYEADLTTSIIRPTQQVLDFVRSLNVESCNVSCGNVDAPAEVKRLVKTLTDGPWRPDHRR